MRRFRRAFAAVTERHVLAVEVKVGRRIVEPDLQPDLAARGDVFADQIPPAHFRPRAEVAKLAGPQGIAVVVPRGEHGIAEAGVLGRLKPFFRIVVAAD